jgi:hypothetical protein
MEMICPLSRKTINENQARMTSILVIILLLAFFYTRNNWIAALLVIDFAIRSFMDCRFSILGGISRFILKVTRIRTKKVNAGPVAFVARIGGILSLFILVFSLTGQNLLSSVTLVILAICVSLYAVFNYCIGCHLYSAIQVITNK